jgi:hypothetical protein
MGMTMKVDERAEPFVRTAIHAAVQRDFASLDEALQGFPDDETTKAAIELALAVIEFVMIDAHGGMPTAANIRADAEDVCSMETWAEPTVDEVESFLTKLLNGERFAGTVPPENVFILSFVVAANLLSSYRRDDEKWWDYLDRVEAAIEARPS